MIPKSEYEEYRKWVIAHASDGTFCFRCKDLINPDAETMYGITKTSRPSRGDNCFIYFHIECFKNIAGDDWLIGD